MECGEGGDDYFPTSGDSVQVPIDFGRKISCIDNQKLSERDIGPEQNKGKQQVAQMMIVRFCNNRCEWIEAPEEGQHHSAKRIGDENLANQENDREHR